MAHLPRWVNDPTVDSSVMLTAFLSWSGATDAAESDELVRSLWIIDPASTPFADFATRIPVQVRGIPLPIRRCVSPGCERCTLLRGGYQFRWFDRRWLDHYERNKKPGSRSFLA